MFDNEPNEFLRYANLVVAPAGQCETSLPVRLEVKRRFAALSPSSAPPALRHYLALPAGIEIPGADELPHAHFVILEEEDGVACVTRYSLQGAFAGDTWHDSTNEALEQLELEYGGRLGEWRDFPADTRDLVNFALASSTEN